MKHGLAGEGIVLTPGDAAEVELRNEALQAELAPKSALGQILVLQMATLSVRMERGARQEFASVANRVRHAAEEFDQARIDEAEWLIEHIAEAPRSHVRHLRKSPEGVTLLIQGWRGLRIDLAQDPQPRWTAAHLELADHLMGYPVNGEPGLRFRRLADAVYGKFQHLAETDGAGLEADQRRAWAKARLVEWIDQQIDELYEHLKTIDRHAIEQDRAEAADRALFDPSKEAALARRYESEARRGFFKALDQFRKVEAEVVEEIQTAPEPAPLASSRENAGANRRDRLPAEGYRPGGGETAPQSATSRPVDREMRGLRAREAALAVG